MNEDDLKLKIEDDPKNENDLKSEDGPIKMSSFLFVHTWSMPHIFYLSCGIPFPVWTPGIISGLASVMVWLSR